MPKITKRYIKNLDPSQIGRMKAPELRELLRGARQLYQSQAKMFEKYSDKVYSHSYQKMKDYYSEHGNERMRTKGGIEFYTYEPKATSDMKLNELRQEMFRLQDFFEAKTSTIPGAKQVNSEMSRRIFGEDKRGRARDTFTTEQWTDFWSIYTEYKNQRPADVYEQSDIVQQMLAQMLKQDFSGMESTGYFMRGEIIKRLKDMIEDRRLRENWEMSNYEKGDAVFTGNRPIRED